MTVKKASQEELKILCGYDGHISGNELKSLISQGRVYICEENEKLIGWLRYNLFWDNTPFMNMLYVLESYRGSGLGKALVRRFEEDMKNGGFGFVMTSTSSEEYAQHFYKRLGYKTAGGFSPPGEPFELIMIKEL